MAQVAKEIPQGLCRKGRHTSGEVGWDQLVDFFHNAFEALVLIP